MVRLTAQQERARVEEAIADLLGHARFWLNLSSESHDRNYYGARMDACTVLVATLSLDSTRVNQLADQRQRDLEDDLYHHWKEATG